MKSLDILLACEASGIVRDEFIKLGHNAISCDLKPSERPGPHHTGDVFEIINNGFDLMIAFPPCTYVCSSGYHWNKGNPERQKKTIEALRFIERLLLADIEKIGLENPVGVISTFIRPASQYIQPYNFGDNASKITGLWLKNLPLLKPTKKILPRFICLCGNEYFYSSNKLYCNICNRSIVTAKTRWANQTATGQNNLVPSLDRSTYRSRTYPGIAKAMALQWGTKQALQTTIF